MKHLRFLPVLLAATMARFHIGTGIERQIRYKKQTAAGTAADGATGGQILRRVTFGLKLTKDTYQSNEKTSHRQVISMRHGFRRSSGGIQGELSPGTYADWHDSILRRDRTAIVDMTGLNITIAASGSEYTITRDAGSFLTGGVKKGMVVRLTAGAFNANNLNKNIVVRLVTATVITGKPLNGSTLTPEGPIATATVSVPGKYSFIPSTGHTEDFYTVEDWNPLLATPLSEQHIDTVLNTMKVTLPASGDATLDFDALARDFARSDTTAYFVSPAEETTTDICASSTAVYIVGDAYYDTITNVDFTAGVAATSSAAGGSNIAPAVFTDRSSVQGNIAAYFEDASLRDAFVDETETGIVFIVANGTDAAADFVSYMMPRSKLNDAGRDDPNTGMTQSVPFMALYNANGGAGTATEKTTLAYQDSAAT